VTCPMDTACTTYACNGTSTCTKTYEPAGTYCADCSCGEYDCNGSGVCNRAVGCHPMPCP
jgi:hypothetical protein